MCWRTTKTIRGWLPIRQHCLFSTKSATNVGHVYYFPMSSRTNLSHLSVFETVSSVEMFGPKTYSPSSQRRPESKVGSSPEQFYSKAEVDKFSGKPRNLATQLEMAAMACHLIANAEVDKRRILDGPLLVLDLGCGYGGYLKLDWLREHFVIGVDISRVMLDCASRLDASPGNVFDLVCGDCTSLKIFRADSVDAVISISTLQWFFSKENSVLVLDNFISSLKHCLKPGSPAVCQFYPRDIEDLNQIVQSSENIRSFEGAIVCCYPHAHGAKKLFLYLQKII